MARADQAEIAEQIRMFGGNLRRARLRAGLTQVQLSAIALLDRAAISRLECGKRTPDLPTLLRICTALEVDPADLLRGIGPMTSHHHFHDRGKGAASKPATRFGANLKLAREQAGISQEKLAFDAKVDRAAISVYENGGREPNLRTVLKLAMKLELRPGLLLRGVAQTIDGVGIPK
jgi:transcriptional regulator with XRE-family HTH domain